MNTTADDANHSKTVTKKVVVDREREVVESEPIDAGPVSLINLTEDFPPDSLEIHLINQRLTGIPDLAPYTMLRHLCFRQNLLTGLEGADLKEGLIELDLYDNRIVDVPQICLASLKSLDLSFNKIHHIKNLDGLPNLTDIYLLANKISKVTNLDNLVSLTNLELGSNNLRVIEGLDNLVNLKQLWVGKNKITHISGLGSLVNLEILSIQSNRITKIEGLDHCKNLKEIYISHNQLTTIDGLDSLVNLETLDISNNQISKLGNLESNPLQEFWASYNLFESFEDIEIFFKDKPINTVYFEGCPVSKNTMYRLKLKTFLPSLLQIDATYVR